MFVIVDQNFLDLVICSQSDVICSHLAFGALCTFVAGMPSRLMNVVTCVLQLK